MDEWWEKGEFEWIPAVELIRASIIPTEKEAICGLKKPSWTCSVPCPILLDTCTCLQVP